MESLKPEAGNAADPDPKTQQPPVNILVVDDDSRTVFALTTTLGDLGLNIVTAHNGDEALLRVLDQDFALILLDVQMPGMDGFDAAALIRSRERSRHIPIIFLTAYNQTDSQVFKGYSLGAVDFMFKPIVAEVLKSKVQVFVDLFRKNQEARRQADLIRDAEAREHERKLVDAKREWEAHLLRQEMEKERHASDLMAEHAHKLSREIADREKAEEELQQANACLTLVSEVATRMLLGERPQEILSRLYAQLSSRLGLEIYFTYLLMPDERTLILDSFSGISQEVATEHRVLSLGEGVSGLVAANRSRLVAEDIQNSGDLTLTSLRKLGLSAYACHPLIADGRLIGTLGFGTRKRREFPSDSLAVMQLVSDQIAMALDRSRLIIELQERDRRKDEFLAMLSHELRNPLAPLTTGLALMSTHTKAEPRLEKMRQLMDRQVKHLVRLVDDLLDVSRITQGKIELRREESDLRAALEHAAQLSRPLIEARHHRFELHLPGQPLPVAADATRLSQVFANLLNNAAKFTPEQGLIALHAVRKGSQVEVRVVDSGMGIRSEMLGRVFELFVQGEQPADRAGGGLGIGLTLVRTLVQLHGGQIAARSKGPGLGSEFVVTLPLSTRRIELKPARVEVVPREPKQLSAFKVAIIEDNADIREVLLDLLMSEGHQVFTANDGHAGIELIRTSEPDVALVDIGLPGIDGYAVARTITEIRKKCGYPRRLIAMTGYGQAEDRTRALDAGFDEHLVKPVDPDRLTQVIQQTPNRWSEPIVTRGANR